MIIGIIGLGLIGGSFAKAIKKNTCHKVLGLDSSGTVMSEAASISAIDEMLTSNTLSMCDIVIIALYPSATIEFVNSNRSNFKKGSIVMDCTGVKQNICATLEKTSQENGFYFIGGHPMAGIEKSGFENSFAELFQNASLILTPYEWTPQAAVQTLVSLSEELGFGKVQFSSPEEHDEMISYTSQLAHVVSCAYVLSPLSSNYDGFSAGSFKDMTRVARLNETMWTDLFIENKDMLCREISALIKRLNGLKGLISSGNSEELKKVLLESRLTKESIDQTGSS